MVTKYESIVFAVPDLQDENDAQSTTLAEARNTLLPKLLSGKVQVGETNIG